MDTITYPTKVANIIRTIEARGLTYEVTVTEDMDDESFPSILYTINVHNNRNYEWVTINFRTNFPSWIRKRTSTRMSYCCRVLLGDRRVLKTARDVDHALRFLAI